MQYLLLLLGAGAAVALATWMVALRLSFSPRPRVECDVKRQSSWRDAKGKRADANGSDGSRDGKLAAVEGLAADASEAV